MASLNRNLRRDLENAVKKARRTAEAGAQQAIEQLAVHHHEPWTALTPEQKKLRNRLRAHGRQLGDRRDEQRKTQTIDRLVGECAYEHWHRLLFARFLAENDLLIEPESGMPLSMDECRELAREQHTDWLPLASGFAQRMLPQIFRADDPVLEIALPPETRQELEQLLEGLPSDVFVADDSLGWVYQFWQSEKKAQVNKSGVKIGADELPAVTQLFTEDYMVLFLLENTLGAWWAGKHLAAHPNLAENAQDEDELRRACGLPGYQWTYLRFVRDGDGDSPWRPAAGNFEGWPREAKALRVLDPCMGSGHFLVFALPILVAMRVAEEGLSVSEACAAVLRDNLFGLEIDPRCTQIAAFNLAFAAWRLGGWHPLPPLNLACSGLGLNAQREDWAGLAGNNEKARRGMEQLYDLFNQAPILGSLINPRKLGGDLFVYGFHDLQALLERALAQESEDDTAHEMAVTARGLANAAEILAGQFTLVATNVPYLGRGKQDDMLMAYCEQAHPAAKADLATCFVERCLDLCGAVGGVAVVAPQNWLFLTSYTKFRNQTLRRTKWDFVLKLGPRAFETIGGEVVNVVLLGFSGGSPSLGHRLTGLDASEEQTPSAKTTFLSLQPLVQVNQKDQLSNPDARIILSPLSQIPLLKSVAEASHGQGSFDSPRFSIAFWEVNGIRDGWVAQQSTPSAIQYYGGCHFLFRWENGEGGLAEMMEAKQEQGYSSGKWKAGVQEWGKPGILAGQMGELPCSLYLGESFDENASVVIPHNPSDLVALWAFCTSDEFRPALKQIDQSIKITCKTLVKVPFDLAHWREVAARDYPNGLPKPHSDDPTQWLFNGHPKVSEQPLQVAVARLVGYRWPRQTGTSFPDCPALGPDGLELHADEDGIVCLTPLRGEPAAAERLRALLADAFGAQWSAGMQNELLAAVGFAGKTLGDWLRDGFFEQHCALFHQRPFVWHVWDGLPSGFSALINYHKLAAPKGEGRRTLEKLLYTYLGDWIDRQRADQTAGVEGADGRLAAAMHLKREVEKILVGEPPYDIFVRWKPLHQQPIGWEPDLDDGVRLNSRPFLAATPLGARRKNACILRVTPRIKWQKDRGKEPRRPQEGYPWFWGWDPENADYEKNFTGDPEFDGNRWNDLHYTRAFKLSARERAGNGSDST